MNNIIKIAVEIGEDAKTVWLSLYKNDTTPTTWATISSSEYSLVFIEKLGRNISLSYKDDKITNSDISLSADMETNLDKFYEDQDIEQEDIIPNDTNSRVNPYNPEDVKVKPFIFSLEVIYGKINKGTIDLIPDFQRHFVWDNKRKSRLIESILLGIPLPVFYFSQNKDSTYSVVDGIQRLNTIYDFMNNKFALNNLEHYDYNGCYYSHVKDNKKEQKTLPAFLRLRIEDTQITANVIESGSPDKLKYDIFRRINEGGKPLNQQEIRNSLATKEVRILLQELAYSSEFSDATQGKSNFDGTYTPGLNDSRMAAQEIVLRYIGFYIEQRQNELKYKDKMRPKNAKDAKNTIQYRGDMNDFLDSTLDHLNALHIDELSHLKNNFLRTLRNCYHLFGKGCFRKCELKDFDNEGCLTRKPLINKALFTIWTIILTEYDEKLIHKLPKNLLLIELAKELNENPQFLQNLSHRTSDRMILDRLFEAAKRLANRTLTPILSTV
jgi:Protein of unknown function DUF262